MDFIRKVFNKLYVILLAIAILMAISAREGKFFGYAFSQIFSKDENVKAEAISIDEAKKIFPDATSMNKLNEDEIQLFDVNHKELGWLLQTMPSCSDINGFNGKVPLLIGINPNKEIIDIIMLDNSETPAFAEKVQKELLNSWNGKLAKEAATLGIDSVTGATYTSNAVIESVKRRLASFEKISIARENLKIKQIISETIAAIFLIIALFAHFMPTKLAKYRNYILIAAVIIPGFWLGRFASLETFNSFGTNGFPIYTQFFLIIVISLAIIIPLLSGKAFYCIWYCPFGAAQELIGKILPKKINISGKLGKFLKSLRPTILIIIVFLLIIGIKFNLGEIEPFSAFKSLAIIPLTIAIIALLLSLFIAKPWCNYFCPTGQILECVRYTPLKVQTNDNKISNQSEDNPNKIKSIDIIKGEDEMKASEVVNLLLVVAIIILLMGQQQKQQINNHTHSSIQAKSTNSENKILTDSSNSKKEPVSTKEQDTMAKEVVVEKQVESISDYLKTSLNEQQILQAIFNRKSVRHYKDNKVEKDKLETVVRAAMAAPSAMNRQPWHFIIIDDPEKAKSLCNALPYAKYNSPAAIVVCGNMNLDTNGTFWIQDCSAATQNLLLAAEALGLGAVWTAVAPDEGRTNIVREQLNLPEHLMPLNVICIGYPTGEDKPKDKWDPSKINWNTIK